MNFKRFILAVSLGATVSMSGQACGWDDPALYNLFRCVEEIPDLEEQHISESTAFWFSYLGGPDKVGIDVDSSVRYMSKWNFDEDNDGNDLITLLRQNGDKAALEFLRLNVELSDLNESRDGWSYRKTTPKDYADLLDRIDMLKVPASLSQRKTFLKMRCLFAVKDYQACQRLWDNTVSKWESSPLRDRMEGYMAGILYRQGNFEEAMQYYLNHGDGESVKLCVNRIIQNTSIEQEYERDPNGKILGYILEDYANYLYHASYHDYWKSEDPNEYKIWTRVTNDRDEVLQLANRVIKERKADDLQMWQAFIGFVQMTGGQNAEAYDSFCKAEQMGAGVVSPLLRHYKLCASLGTEGSKKAGYDQYLVDELAYKNKMYNAESQMDDVERNVLYVLYEDLLQRRFYDYCAKKDDPLFTYLVHTIIEPYTYRFYLDGEFSIDQTKAVRDFVVSRGKDNPVYAKLLDTDYITSDFVNEILGTKLLRAGEFVEAASYLEQVSEEFLNTQSIASYLNLRPMESVLPFRRMDCSNLDDVECGPATNRKLEFCQRAEQLRQGTLNASSAEQRAKAAYDLACLMFQGSASGDLWAVSQYGHSSYEDDYNELCDLAAKYLKQALSETKDPQLTILCQFGLAATPVSQNVTYYSYEGDKPCLQVSNKQQYDAYQYINGVDRSNEVCGRCDWLGLYVRLAEN